MINKSTTQADLEYEICGTFIRHTGEKLSSKEL